MIHSQIRQIITQLRVQKWKHAPDVIRYTFPVHSQVENLENERRHNTGTKCSDWTHVADTHFKGFFLLNGHRDQSREYTLGDDLAVRYFVEDPDQIVGEKIDQRRYSVRRRR